MEIIIGTDASWVVDDVTAALSADGVNFTVCREGRIVSDLVEENTPDLVILDMQIGSMGGPAVTMSLRLDESSGLLPHVPVLMLLDRRADLHLARRTGARDYRFSWWCLAKRKQAMWHVFQCSCLSCES